MFVTWSKPEGPDPLSILAHQLRRRFPPNSSLHKGGARSIYLTARPEGSLVFRPSRPGIRTEALQPKPPDALRPFLGRSLLRPASLTELPSPHEENPNSGNRVALEKINSSGASSRLAPTRTEALIIACRRRSELRDLPPEGGSNRRPDHMSTMHLVPESQKQNFW